MKQIIEAIRKLLEWVNFLLWIKPTSEPIKESTRFKEVIAITKEYMVITYDGQRINMLKIEHPFWKKCSRKDKRAMAKKFGALEKSGKIRFETIEGELVAIKNKDYESDKKTDKR